MKTWFYKTNSKTSTFIGISKDKLMKAVVESMLYSDKMNTLLDYPLGKKIDLSYTYFEIAQLTDIPEFEVNTILNKLYRIGYIDRNA